MENYSYYYQRSSRVMHIPYAVARGVILWLMMLNPGFVAIGVAGGAAVGFGAEYLLLSERMDRAAGDRAAADRDKTTKDAEQDARMDAADARAQQEAADRVERRAEIREKLDTHDAEIKDLSDSVHQLYGWGAGAFGAVTVLQIIGILRKNKED